MRGGSGLALCTALVLSACGSSDQLDPGAANVRGVQPTLEQLGISKSSQLQDQLLDRLITTAGYPSGSLGPGDTRWSMVFEAGVYEVGRQCDQYLDALSRFNRQQPANRQGLIAVAAASGAILGPAGVTTAAIAITAVAFGLSASLFDASVSSALFSVEASVLRTIVQRGHELYLARIAKDRISINSRPRMMAALQDYLRQCSPAAIEADINGTAGGAQSVTSADPGAGGLAAPALAAMTAMAVINGDVVTASPPLPPVSRPAGGLPQETLPTLEVARVQKALGVAGNGTYGAKTRDAIREFQTAMYRRNPLEWPLSQAKGNLTGRSGRILPSLTPMPPVFLSPFERAYLGTDGGFFTADPLSAVDPARLEGLLAFLGAPPAQIAAATTPEARMELLRRRIQELRTGFKLPTDKGAVLDAAFYKLVWKDSPLNVDHTE